MPMRQALSRMRLVMLGLFAAGLTVVAAGWLDAAEPPTAAPVQAEQPKHGESGASKDSSLRIDAPGTQVAVDKERGKVKVTAPYTDVQVDPDKGRVQVRAPYVNLDIRW